jgi:hypothetical protein
VNKIASFFKKRNAPFFIGPLWIGFTAFGFFSLLTYANKPGEVGKISNGWPPTSSLVANSAGPTLLIFSHPKCPCTRATARELERVMAQVQGKPLTTYVLIYKPSDRNEEWAQTDLEKKFESIPGVNVLMDVDGQEAARFGALTSGQAFLYSKEGSLLFNGGITPSRGDEGDSVGKDSIASLVVNGSTLHPTSRVFGCSFRKPANIGWKED